MKAADDGSVIDVMRLALWFQQQRTRPTFQEICKHFNVTPSQARRYMRLYLRAVSESPWDWRYWVALKQGKVQAALIDDDYLTAPGQLSDFLAAMESRGLRVERRLYKDGQTPLTMCAPPALLRLAS